MNTRKMKTLPHVSDALIERAKIEPEKFAMVYDAYHRVIFTHIWHRVGHDTDLAEDMAQETFTHAFAGLAQFHPNGSYLTYLYTIAHNLLVNHYRSPGTVSLESAPTPCVEPWQDIVRDDENERLWRAVRDLSPIDHTVLYGKYHDGLSVHELAMLCGKSDNAIKLALVRARKRLAKYPDLDALTSHPRGIVNRAVT